MKPENNVIQLRDQLERNGKIYLLFECLLFDNEGLLVKTDKEFKQFTII